MSFGQSDALFKKAELLIQKGETKEVTNMLNGFLKTDPNHPKTLHLLGKLYLQERNFKLAILYLNKSVEKSPNPVSTLYFDLAEAYQHSQLFEDAIENYEKVTGDKRQKVLIDKRIKECRVGQELISNPLEVKISNLGNKINSSKEETHPLVSADFMQLFFTGSDKPDDLGSASIFQSFNRGGWEKAIPLPSPISSDKGESCAGISADGLTIYIIRPVNGNDIFISEFKEGNWTKPKPFPFNSPKAESSVSVSADGKRLFFVSNRTGNKDIFTCSKDGRGNWVKPVKLGNGINTSQDEESPWLDAENKFLYFSSKGHSGMGGYDIFKVPFGSPLAEPENIGYPINSASDDLYYMVIPDGKTAFYSSAKDGGMGGFDLYSIQMSVGKAPQLALFKGTISDLSGLPVDATVVVTDLETGKPMAKLKAHPETGTFVTMLQAGKSYSVLVEREGYLFYSDLLNLSDNESLKELNRDIRMQKLQPGVTLILNNIFFENGKSSLKKESTLELQRILMILRQNSGLKVEISGHLDPDGPEEVSQKLTENRAQAVVDYLVATGIKSTRIVSKGYGSSKPIADNKTEKGRQQNRRTEFRIISML